MLIPAIFLLAGCKDKYLPAIPATDTNILVVEGVLNAGNEPTIIKITRSYGINGTISNLKQETGATVTVEGSDNSKKPLTMVTAGSYENNDLALSPDKEYRLRIKTNDGKEYLSAFVKVKMTPEIDSIGVKQTGNDISLFVNTHDPSNNTRYYKWSYEETWEINSFYHSYLIYDKLKDTVRDREIPLEDVFQCWKYSNSSSIIFGSSAKLTQDIIYEQPLKTIINGDDRLSVRYSILVKQYAMDKDAYEFFNLMKKNTESLGSIFDAQPSEIRGNITCITNPDEIVIGYISASTIVQKRIFLSPPRGWNFRQFCEEKIVTPDSIGFYFASGMFIPVSEKPREGSIILDYVSSAPSCVDCQVRGGNLRRPSYW